MPRSCKFALKSADSDQIINICCVLVRKSEAFLECILETSRDSGYIQSLGLGGKLLIVSASSADLCFARTVDANHEPIG